MGLYSIKQLELLSGVKAHTIRIWEKRYNLFSPTRTKTNIRKYTDEDVRLILNIKLLISNGHKISKVAKRSNEEISKLIIQEEDHRKDTAVEPIEQLIIATMAFNSIDFNAYIQKKIDELGFIKTYENIILPFLERLGVLWQAGAIQTTHEHFASNQIKFLITRNFSNLPEVSSNSPKAIFFLPEGEFHELGLLVYAYLLKQKGFYIIYFGQSTPTDDLLSAAKEIKPKIVFTSISTKFSKIDLNDLSKKLNKLLPSSELLVTGYYLLNQSTNFLPKHAKLVASVNSLQKYIKTSS